MHLFYYVLNFMFLIVVAVVNGQNRIVGGNRVKYRENFPYQISLRVHGQHICGGTIYKPQYVITAAHCMHNIKASQLEIVAGDLNLRYPSKHTQRSKVSKIHVHKGFNDAIENDVAVLQLKNKLLFNDYVGNITIWNSTEIGSDPKETQPCVVSGWGAKEYNGNVINDLTFANVTLFSPEICERIYSSTFYSPGMVCAGNFTHARDACTGDSGGPLVCEGRLYGIVSWGIRCGLPHFPGIYTNASFYNSWIEANHGIGINFNRFHCIGVFILLLYLFI